MKEQGENNETLNSLTLIPGSGEHQKINLHYDE